ncbi:MAG: hypothetical protein WA633_02855, partial [Stellaceae bacterium]
SKVQATSLTIRMKYTDFDDYWGPIGSAQGPVGDYVKGLPPDRLDTLAQAVRAAYLAGVPDGPLDGGDRVGRAWHRLTASPAAGEDR